jgi:hypothetical protein
MALLELLRAQSRVRQALLVAAAAGTAYAAYRKIVPAKKTKEEEELKARSERTRAHCRDTVFPPLIRAPCRSAGKKKTNKKDAGESRMRACSSPGVNRCCDRDDAHLLCTLTARIGCLPARPRSVAHCVFELSALCRSLGFAGFS